MRREHATTTTQKEKKKMSKLPFLPARMGSFLLFVSTNFSVVT